MAVPNPDFDPTARRVGGFVLVLALVWLALIGHVVYPALPYSTVELPTARALRTTLWAPQGWAFFTKDPREPQIQAFGLTDGRWTTLLRAPHSNLRNVLGLDRTSRVQGVEAALLLTEIPSDSWKECMETPVGCLDEAGIAALIDNPSPAPTLCGTVALVFEEPLPWAWARANAEKRIDMPSRYAVAEVAC